MSERRQLARSEAARELDLELATRHPAWGRETIVDTREKIIRWITEGMREGFDVSLTKEEENVLKMKTLKWFEIPAHPYLDRPEEQQGDSLR